MQKTLSSLKVDEKVIDNMEMAIKKFNTKNLRQINKNEFRRLAYELLSQHILQNIQIPTKVN